MRRNRLSVIAIVGALLLGAVAATAQDELKQTIFKNANTAFTAAKKVKADVLAPKNFGKAMSYFQEANSDFERGRNLDNIRRKLQGSVSYFKKAIEATKLAEVTFSATIKARQDANAAGGASFSSETWGKAEEKFSSAAVRLEDGNVNDARKRASEAETLYRSAELDAIKANYLRSTWALLERADELKVREFAPLTLARSQDLVRRAEKELNENRYDTDVARNLAQVANYEAKHAIYLAGIMRQLKRNKTTTEEILLDAEKPLQKLASGIDVSARFDTGFEDVVSRIQAHIQTYEDSAAKLAQELEFTQNRASGLTERIAELETQLGGIAKEKSALAQRMEAEARVREQFLAVEKMFAREEARVFREGDQIFLRMVGLTFASGKSDIEAQNFGLLTKVQKAIRTFPRSQVRIEGHTDSFGSDTKNMELSVARAEAVRQYLLANMGLTPGRVESVGYGESQPIANNETAEGRAKNRRIDLIIMPQIAATN